ncbi:S49 family peptidase [Mucilaginibacter sp. Bleaf8]|uniref:S49 family peptidase n=1 Tax=Mucilaginibacter sp. Bleaf8 TaxID=2834430 RepID=UPI001BCB3862|nr:S49 family peptidase [Mucilaginibacter sp. Bleaf8]MBS7565140.1 S49 family peptidase [Mucilaginibacter sp. Bleaf8]
MRLDRLASAILRGSFLLEPRQAAGLLQLADRYVQGEKVSWFDASEDSAKEKYLDTYIISPEGARGRIKADQSGTRANIFEDAPEGSIFVLPVQGTIMKDDNCGAPGTDTLSSWLIDARDAKRNLGNIIGGVIHINSGGGSVEGTAEFASLILEVAKEVDLEVYVDGMIASAAYWIGCGLTITASSETVEVGSIGTAVRFTDYSQYYANQGIKQIYINADPSFDKNQDTIQAIAGNFKPIKDAILNPTNEVFHAAVKAARGDKLKLTDVESAEGVKGQEPLTGKMYLAKKAMEIGLIDNIGTMETVFTSIRSRVPNDQLFAHSNNQDMSLFGNKFKKLNALKGKKAADITDAEIVAVNEELTAEGIDNISIISAAHVQEANANADAVSEGLSAINAALDGAEHTSIAEAIDALIADRDAEKAIAEEYGDQPGNKPSKPKTKAESEGGDAKAKKYADMNELEKKAHQRKLINDKKAKMNFKVEDDE